MTAETGSCRCLPGRINRRIDLERSRRGGDPRLRQDFTVAGKRLLFRRRRMFRAARYDVRRGFFAVAPQGARRSRRVQIEFVTWSMDVLARRGKLSLRCASGVMRAGSSRSRCVRDASWKLALQWDLVWRRMPGRPGLEADAGAPGEAGRTRDRHAEPVGAQKNLCPMRDGSECVTDAHVGQPRLRVGGRRYRASLR
jgi:hypothetical protein